MSLRAPAEYRWIERERKSLKLENGWDWQPEERREDDRLDTSWMQSSEPPPLTMSSIRLNVYDHRPKK